MQSSLGYPAAGSYPGLLPQQLQQAQQRAAEQAGQSWGGPAPSPHLLGCAPAPSGRQIHPQVRLGLKLDALVQLHPPNQLCSNMLFRARSLQYTLCLP